MSKSAILIVAAMDRGDGGILNVGSGRGTSILEIFESLSELTGFRGEAEFGPARQGDVFKIYLQAERARESLGWQPRISLLDGLSSTVHTFRLKKPV